MNYEPSEEQVRETLRRMSILLVADRNPLPAKSPRVYKTVEKRVPPSFLDIFQCTPFEAHLIEGFGGMVGYNKWAVNSYVRYN
jgi:hypothetical protein